VKDSEKDCGCQSGGCCGPRVSRRDFLGYTIGAAGWSIFGFPGFAGASPDHRLTESELANWKTALFGRGVPIKYRPKVNPLAAVPLGGIGCGNVYVGADGTLSDWLIFNNVHPVQVPDTFLAIHARQGGRSVSKLLQTVAPKGAREGAPEAPLVEDIEMTGEYPFAFLDYIAPDLPVRVRLEAFSPFVPLDSESSAFPAVVFVLHVRNESQSPASVSVALAARNTAGFGVECERRNRAVRRGRLTAVEMGLTPGSPARISPRINLLTTARDFTLLAAEMPPGLSLQTPRDADVSADEIAGVLKQKGAKPVIWLEDPSGLSPEAARALGEAAGKGATILFAGATSFLNRWAASRGKSPGPARPDIVVEDFENGTYAGWKVEGTAFGDSPQTGTLPHQNQVSGWQGRYLVNSFVGGDDTTGKLTGKPFTIQRRCIRMLIGGGSRAASTCVNLVVDGIVVRSQRGRGNERLEPALWDVSGLEGKEAHIEIVDSAAGGWGHINVDDIVQTDAPFQPLEKAAAEALDGLLPCAFERISEGIKPLSVTPGGPVASLNAPLSLDRLDEMIAPVAAPDRQVLLAAPDGRPVLVERPAGKGRVLLLLAPLAGNRAQALSVIAAVAGGEYEAGSGVQPVDASFGDLAIGTTADDARAVVSWRGVDDLLRCLADKESGDGEDASVKPGIVLNAAVTAAAVVPPGGEAAIPLFLTWRFPNYYFSGRNIGNRYAARWKGAARVAEELAARFDDLRESTHRYRSTLYETSLPYWLIDCLSSQSSTIRSEVCVWTGEDAFAGFEGSGGCCPMNCSHVWGYEQTLAFLFPDLERRMRNADLKHQQNEDGGLNNRVALPLASHPTGERPFADGHASGILKAYREHLNSPDMSFLREYYPNIRKAVDYLLKLDGQPPDGVLEVVQWNTYDCQVTGPNSFIGSYYLAALRAGEEMALLMGDTASARKWRGVFESGRRRLTQLTWNGEYFYQNFPGYETMATQYGPGCLADQLIGQWWAHLLGLGYILPERLVKKALASVFRYNWLSDLSDWKHSQRVFADGHDKGLLCCTWPRGGRPNAPILYCDEVWTGVEYQVAAHMVYEGMLQEALAIVAGARERYDGSKRNPWNEIECGGHYARAMSSWSLLIALGGFRYDGPRGTMTFAPVLRPESFQSFFSAAEGWGSFSQTRSEGQQECELRLDGGTLRLNELRLAMPEDSSPRTAEARVSGRQPLPVSFAKGRALIDVGGRTLTAGDTLSFRVRRER